MSSSFGKMLLICNARAGRGGVAKSLPEVERALRERELDYSIHHTTGPGDATQAARAALEKDTRLVVAVGGDGTIHEVVNGMIEDDKPVRPDAALGVIAAGTGCDFIKTFGIPPTPTHAVAHLDGEESFEIDIGKVTFMRDGAEVTRYFPNIAEAGLGASCVARAERLPRWLGPTVYMFAFWLEMRKWRIPDVTVDLVDRTYEGKMNNLVVANGQFFGGGMKVAPKAAPTDGLLDIQIEHTRKKEALAMIQKIYKGTHVPHPDIEEAKRAKVAITSPTPLLVEADGELLGQTPATFEILRSVISLKV
jgi:diacylglycerol kinase (ATP)